MDSRASLQKMIASDCTAFNFNYAKLYLINPNEPITTKYDDAICGGGKGAKEIPPSLLKPIEMTGGCNDIYTKIGGGCTVG